MTSSSALQTELWTSWASLLRSYAAAHGLNAPQHAIVEVSSERITLRVGSRWLSFSPTEFEASGDPPQPFHLNQDGTVSVANQPPQEMDMAAERFAREVLFEQR